MIEIHPDVFVGGADDRYKLMAASVGMDEPPPGWHLIVAAKDPWHRAALGYETRAAPKDDPEYLVAERERQTVLNLIDAPDPAYIPDIIMATAIKAIDDALEAGMSVLVHCNEGLSRAPSIGLWWLRNSHFTKPAWSRLPFDQAVEAFKELVPDYAPGKGIEGWLRAHWASEA